MQYAKTVELAYPGVKVTRGCTFEDIWTLFLDSGFLYPEKVARLQPVLPEIQQTVRALLQANGNLMGTVVLRNEMLLEAHMSILRWYEQTWIVQHLAALPLSARALDASAQLTLGFTYYVQLRPDIQWGKMFFRPNNAWPTRVFGGFARQIKDPRTSDLRVFHYLAAATNASSPKVSGSIHVRSAGERDFGMIEEWFSSRGRTVEVLANDLQPSRASLANLSEDYRTVGLTRHRDSIIAEREGRITGFALLEISSLGMNFSELTNAFSVHLMDDDRETQLALVMAARHRYAELGRLQCIALEESDDLSAFEAAGFVKIKDYTCWTFHREHLADMEEYFITLFGARRRRNA